MACYRVIFTLSLHKNIIHCTSRASNLVFENTDHTHMMLKNSVQRRIFVTRTEATACCVLGTKFLRWPNPTIKWAGVIFDRILWSEVTAIERYVVRFYEKNFLTKSGAEFTQTKKRKERDSSNERHLTVPVLHLRACLRSWWRCRLITYSLIALYSINGLQHTVFQKSWCLTGMSIEKDWNWQQTHTSQEQNKCI
jgi:hypothetical protein